MSSNRVPSSELELALGYPVVSKKLSFTIDRLVVLLFEHMVTWVHISGIPLPVGVTEAQSDLGPGTKIGTHPIMNCSPKINSAKP